ncbi:MAG: sodium ion-translocating decarboxylase subunit beta [Phycisphaeraceae bacterium]|nr:sodium ion-translocating decarboxylase subunit beta [Phycisphaeraceae bacterium]
MQELLSGLTSISAGQGAMFVIAGLLIWLAIAKEYEPTLLLPMGFGAILANIPFSAAIDQMTGGQVTEGPLSLLFRMGIATELFPLLIFIAIGAMIDFTPLLQQPILLLFGAAAQVGIFLTMGLAALGGFSLKEAASIGVIGAADGPTSIYVAAKFAPHLLGPISVAAYSYMALVPIIQPPVIKALTTRRERARKMELHPHPVSRKARIIFPILLTLLAGLLVPMAAGLIGFLMFGNLLREAGVVERLAKGAQNELANLVTILLGITIGATMTAAEFLQTKTLLIMGMGLAAFVFDTAGGVIFAKVLNLFLVRKVNPMIGACGISAFPMSARVIHKLGQEADPQNILLMHAVGANVGGQIGSVIAGGLLLALVS